MSNIEFSFELEDFENQQFSDFEKKWTKKFKNEIGNKMNYEEQQNVRKYYTN